MHVELGKYVQQAWLVLLLAVALSAALAVIDRSLEARIATHARDRLNEAILEVVPGGVESRPETRAGQTVHRVTGPAGTLIGWAVPAETMGFADKIQLMIGLDAAAERITGLVIVGSRETPGLGEKIRTPEFRGRFVGQPATTHLEVVKPGRSAEHPIDAITGATISSQAVTEGVNQHLAAVRAALAAEPAEDKAKDQAEAASVDPDEREEPDTRTSEDLP